VGFCWWVLSVAAMALATRWKRFVGVSVSFPFSLRSRYLARSTSSAFTVSLGVMPSFSRRVRSCSFLFR